MVHHLQLSLDIEGLKQTKNNTVPKGEMRKKGKEEKRYEIIFYVS